MTSVASSIGRGRGGSRDAHRLRRRATFGLTALAVVLAALALAWRYTPLAEVATPEHVTALARAAAGARWTPLAVIVAYPIAAVIMFPRPLITLFAVVAFGPAMGFAYAMVGVFTSATVTYLTGHALPARTVERMMTDKLKEVRAIVEERGFLAMLAISIVPVAPFIVVGAAAGAMRVQYRSYIAGVLLGHVPGTLTTSILGDQLKAALEGRSTLNHALIAGVIVFFVATTFAVRRWFAGQRRTLARRGTARASR